MSREALERIWAAKLRQSTTLDLSNCGIENELPKELGELTWLEDLNLTSNNPYDAQPRLLDSELNLSVLEKLTALKRLDLSGANAVDISPLKGLRQLKKLFLCGTQVVNISPLKGLSQLTLLHLADTPVADLSPLRGLTQLTTLNFWNSKVTDIEPLKGLTQLTGLHFYNTQVADISFLKGLTQLIELSLSDTQIGDVNALKGLVQLKFLDLHNTQIVDISPLEELTRPIFLALWNTQVADISPLKGLIEKGMHVNTSTFDAGTGIFLKNCPLTNPPLEIAKQGNEAILKYWEDLEKSEALHHTPYVNADVRLILVGNGHAGKTALRIYLEENRLSTDHLRTHGMEVRPWNPTFTIEKLKHGGNAEGKCKVRLIDFGGQEYYHDTHHLFFQDNTAYLLLWDKAGNTIGEVDVPQRNPQDPATQWNYPLDYWLAAIAFHSRELANNLTKEEIDDWEAELEGGDEWGYTDIHWEMPMAREAVVKEAPTLVVQSKIDLEGTHFLDQQALKEKHPFIHDFCAVSLNPEAPKRLDALQDMIREMLEGMRIVGDSLPVQYGWVKEAVEGYAGEDYVMSRARFRAWANEAIAKRTKSKKVFLDDVSIGVVLIYLSRIGLLLYFPDNETLADKVFLCPDKVLERIYSILKGLQPLEGRFDDDHVAKALGRTKKAKPQDPEASTLLALMQHFKIIFLEGGQPGKYVAPLYLNANPIQGVQLFLDLFQKPVYRVQYPGFIHKSVVLHFFEEYGPKAFSEKAAGGVDLYYYWRNGIVLKDESSGARVMVQFFIGKENPDAPGTYIPAHIDIFHLGAGVQSPFLLEVLNTLEKINKGWNTEVMVTADGQAFVPLKVAKAAGKARQPVFFDGDRAFQLRDFREYLDLDMPMKKVFISYSKADTDYLKQLENHLSVFKRNGLIDVWNCRKLEAGDEWDHKIRKELEEADIILFLVSADFLATDYIWDVEIKRAVERHDAGTAVVVPIVVRSCVWDSSPLGKFNSPEKAAVLDLAVNVDAAWVKVVQALEKVMVGKGREDRKPAG